MDWQEDIGNQIRRAREAAQLTQEELAAKVGLSRRTIIQYEGGNQAVDVDVITRLAAILKAPFTLNNVLIRSQRGRTPRKSASETQICFAFEETYTLKKAVLQVKPSRRTLSILALAPLRVRRRDSR